MRRKESCVTIYRVDEYSIIEEVQCQYIPMKEEQANADFTGATGAELVGGGRHAGTQRLARDLSRRWSHGVADDVPSFYQGETLYLPRQLGTDGWHGAGTRHRSSRRTRWQPGARGA